MEFSRHLLLTGSDIQCGCHFLQYQDYSLKSPETPQLPQNIWCLASAVKRFYPQAPLSCMLRFCRGRCGGCRQHLQAYCTIGSLMHLLRNTCANNFRVLPVFVQNTWVYCCCGNYNYDFPDFAADKNLCTE